jgi:hypothetical protein
MASRREDAMVSADSHEGSEEADGPEGHNNDPCKDVWAILRDVEDLEVEERNGGLDEPDGEDAGYDERVVVLAMTQLS